MKAALFYGPDKIRIENTPLNNDLNDNFLLKILSCSVCSYDVRTFRNGSFKVKPPVILGHEICAQSLDNFELQARGIKSNMRFSLYPVIPCLSCWYCENKRFNLCSNLLELGSTVNGGFAEYILIPKKLVSVGGLVEVPENVSNEEASLIEPLACCINGINQIKDLDFGSVIILGDGPIGLMQLILFKKFFPERKVTIVGKIPNRLEVAIKIGADQVILLKDIPPHQTKHELENLRNDYSPNLIFVSNNNPKSVDLAFELANKNGKIVLFSGIKDSFDRKSTVLSINLNKIHYDQISLFGSFSSTPKDMEYAMKLLASNEINLTDLITNTFALDDMEKALITSENFIGLKSIVNKF